MKMLGYIKSGSQHISVEKFLSLVDAMRNSPESFRPYATGHPPLNFLNISGESSSLEFVHSRIVQALELTLVNHLSSKVRMRHRPTHGIGKRTVHESVLVDGDSCSQFQLLGFPGTISMWHMDVMGMTWVQTLSGMKAWCIVDAVEDEALWAAFKDTTTGGTSWRPTQGTVKTLPLVPGHTLLMMPGKFTAHLPVSAGDTYTHMIGGQVWPQDPAYLAPLLKSLLYLTNMRRRRTRSSRSKEVCVTNLVYIEKYLSTCLCKQSCNSNLYRCAIFVARIKICLYKVCSHYCALSRNTLISYLQYCYYTIRLEF
jgi:hypothetical protein